MSLRAESYKALIQVANTLGIKTMGELFKAIEQTNGNINLLLQKQL